MAKILFEQLLDNARVTVYEPFPPRIRILLDDGQEFNIHIQEDHIEVKTPMSGNGMILIPASAHTLEVQEEV
jgi:hypothetical protein